MALYHKDLGLPSLRYPTGVIQLVYSQHALRQARIDRYGSFVDSLPEFLEHNPTNIIEVETNELGHIVKILYRIRLDNVFDICLAIIPQRNFVKTVWLQEAIDNHRTLNHSCYTRVKS